jgi:hypothetical protein
MILINGIFDTHTQIVKSNFRATFDLGALGDEDIDLASALNGLTELTDLLGDLDTLEQSLGTRENRQNNNIFGTSSSSGSNNNNNDRGSSSSSSSSGAGGLDFADILNGLGGSNNNNNDRGSSSSSRSSGGGGLDFADILNGLGVFVNKIKGIKSLLQQNNANLRDASEELRRAEAMSELLGMDISPALRQALQSRIQGDGSEVGALNGRSERLIGGGEVDRSASLINGPLGSALSGVAGKFHGGSGDTGRSSQLMSNNPFASVLVGLKGKLSGGGDAGGTGRNQRLVGGLGNLLGGEGGANLSRALAQAQVAISRILDFLFDTIERFDVQALTKAERIVQAKKDLLQSVFGSLFG